MKIEFIKHWRYGKIHKKLSDSISKRIIVEFKPDENQKFDHQREFGIVFRFEWIGWRQHHPVKRLRKLRFPAIVRFRIDKRWVYLKENGKWEPSLWLGFVVHESVGIVSMNPNGVRSFITDTQR